MRHDTLSSIPTRWLIQVRGYTNLQIVDQEGRRIGPSQNPDHPEFFENQIPGATFKPGQMFNSVFLTEAGIYNCIVSTPVASMVHIALSLYDSTSQLFTFFFQGIPLITGRSRAQLVYDTANESSIPILEADHKGDGTIEHIQPTILSPQASKDTIPPKTQIDISDNIVTLHAMDNPGGAGVWQTYYTTDGITQSVYTEPFPIPPDAKIIMAYSEDRAGNLEYPGAVFPVLGISKTKVILRVKEGDRNIVQQVIDVVNLDPMPLTVSLQWEAFTETRWLFIEPHAGLTPHSIIVSARGAKLKPGVHKAKVVIRALTPDTVFAERTVDVEVKVNTVPKSKRK